MTDDFEYFSLIGRGGSCTPSTRTPERELGRGSPKQGKHTMSDNRKEVASRVNSHGREFHGTSDSGKDEMRPRTNSMPSKNHLLRVRNFQTTGKKFANCGDTVKAASHCSLVSSDNSSDGHSDSEELLAARDDSSDSSNTHRILLLGAEGVGKTALTQQFLTSDDIAGADYLGELVS